MASGVPLPAKRRAKKANVGPRQAAQAPMLLQPDHFRLTNGVFVAGSPSQDLSQLDLSKVGPQAVGVIMTTKALAEPYLHLNKPVSAGPLAILLLGEDDPSVIASTACKVQFPATCQPLGNLLWSRL